MAMWFEAWTMPTVGNPITKVAGPIAIENGAYQRVLSGIGNGQITLRSSDPDVLKIADPPNNVERLIRVFEDGENVYSFVAATVNRSYDPDNTVQISGPGVESLLDKILVYPFDWAGSDIYPASEITGVSTFRDTIYGGENILANGGFEQGLTNEVQGISHDYRPTTTLNGAIDDVVTSLTLTDGTNFPTGDFRLVIGTERIHVTTRTGNSCTGLTRGYGGTTAAAHANLAEVEGGGSFTLTYSGQTTVAIDWDGVQADGTDGIEEALIALSNIVDVDVSGSGTVNQDPWLIEFIDPGGRDNPILTFTNISLTGGTEFNIVEKEKGGKGDPSPWTRSFNPNDGIFHGSYDTFTVGSALIFGDPAHTGDKALGIDPRVPTGSGEDNYPGAQQIIPVQQGGIYQLSAWVYANEAGQFSLVLRDLNENLIRKTTVSVPATTWTQIAMANVSIALDIGNAIFRVAAELPTDTGIFWIDDCEMTEGYQTASVGSIVVDMFTFATAQGRAVNWLDRSSFNGATDSNGVAWADSDVSVILRMGMTWAQVMEDFAALGYEWEVVWNAGLSKFSLRIYNPGTLGTDRTTDDAPGIRANRVLRADAQFNEPRANTILGLGSDAQVDEVTDAALVAAYGRREEYLSDPDALDLTTLALHLGQRLDENKRLRTAMRVVLDDRVRLGPNLDADLGDYVKAFLPPLLNAETNVRIVSVSVLITSEGEIVRQADIDQRVYREQMGGTTSSATSQAVNRLLRKFDRIESTVKATSELVNLIPQTGLASGYWQFTWVGNALVAMHPFRTLVTTNITIVKVGIITQSGMGPVGANLIGDLYVNGVAKGLGLTMVAGTESALTETEIVLMEGDYLQVGYTQIGSTFSGGNVVWTVEFI